MNIRNYTRSYSNLMSPHRIHRKAQKKGPKISVEVCEICVKINYW